MAINLNIGAKSFSRRPGLSKRGRDLDNKELEAGPPNQRSVLETVNSEEVNLTQDRTHDETLGETHGETLGETLGETHAETLGETLKKIIH